ncbi:MAG: TonB-dependent receptor [Pseudobdellovibrionaceae bacterium]|nr:TonB-dependent receptor [Pseudobdellovibrionaceae bacterium]
MKKTQLVLVSCLLSVPILAQEKSSEYVEVEGKRLDPGRQRDSNSQTESLSGETLRQYGAHSLADAISQASGVNTQTFCANCGAKRITIDGLRGEHTTILIDGFPMHSTISAFYGVDAIPVVGLSGIEVMRGAGQSLTAPEAIGGVLNLLTVNPKEKKLQIFTEYGSHGSRQASVLASSEKIVLTAQQGELESWDLDSNGIGESPFRKTQTYSLKLNEKIGENRLSLRHSDASLLIIGGNTEKVRPTSFTRIQAQPSDFIDRDVTKKFIGDLGRITDVIELHRKETAFSLQRELGTESEVELKLSQVHQHQNAQYSHGYDYRNNDQINFAELAYQKALGAHVLTAAAETRWQRMESRSEALYIERLEPLTPDSLKFRSQALSLRDTWILSDHWSFDSALRLDQLHTDWTDLDYQVDETIAAPRINTKYLWDDHISSQISYGIGYRPPLTLFESEHGSNHDGFLVRIDKVERAQSWVYSLSGNYPDWFLSGTVHHTQLENMAYAFDKVPKGQPLVFENSDESYGITTADVFAGGRLWENLNLQVGYEQFFYPDEYTEKLPSAALEQRLTFDFDWSASRWDLGLQLSWIGSRDLGRYGYDQHYKVYDLDVASPTFGEVSEQKNQHAPAFWYGNARSRWKLSDNYSVSARVNNLFNFTQTSYGDSPTTWHDHLNHAHFDNFHTWGPLMGREYFWGIEGSW